MARDSFLTAVAKCPGLGSLLGFIAIEILTADPIGQVHVVSKYHHTYDRISFLLSDMSGSGELCVL